MAWASLMLAQMYEKLGWCISGTNSFYFGSVLVYFFMEHIMLLCPPKVVVEVTGWTVLWM